MNQLQRKSLKRLKRKRKVLARKKQEDVKKVAERRVKWELKLKFKAWRKERALENKAIQQEMMRKKGEGYRKMEDGGFAKVLQSSK